MLCFKILIDKQDFSVSKEYKKTSFYRLPIALSYLCWNYAKIKRIKEQTLCESLSLCLNLCSNHANMAKLCTKNMQHKAKINTNKATKL